MTAEVGNSVSCPEHDEGGDEYSNKFKDLLEGWRSQGSEYAIPREDDEYDFDATLGFWKSHDNKRRKAKAPHRHSIRKKIIKEVKAEANGAVISSQREVLEVVHHDHGADSHYSPESPCVYIPPARPLHEAVPTPPVEEEEEELFEEDEEEILEEAEEAELIEEPQPRSRWNWKWTRAAIVGGVTLTAAVVIPLAYKYAMDYYYPEEEEDCNCINDGIWKFVIRTLFKMREPKPVRKPFFGLF